MWGSDPDHTWTHAAQPAGVYPPPLLSLIQQDAYSEEDCRLFLQGHLSPNDALSFNLPPFTILLRIVPWLPVPARPHGRSAFSPTLYSAAYFALYPVLCSAFCSVCWIVCAPQASVNYPGRGGGLRPLTP